MQLIVRPQSYRDIAEEIEYLATKAGPETALRWRAALHATLETLAKQPLLGRARPDLQPDGLRSWRMEKFRRWLVFYAVREKAVVLLRVRYGMMDLLALNMES
jgi:plasmid stabilization system protein ParE